MANHTTPIETLARKTAESRRTLMSMFRSPLGHDVALDLMGIPAPTPAHVAFANIIRTVHAETLSRSMLFLADADMVSLMDVAAPTMPDQELHPTDVIAPDGFVYLAEPLPDRSESGTPVPVAAFSWCYLPEGSPLLAERGVGDSILLTFYVRTREQLEANGMLRPGTEVAPGAPGLMANSTVIWTIGTLIGEAFGEVPKSTTLTPGFYQRVAAAFWTLSQQPKMTTSTEEPPGKPTDQRRYRRAGIANPAAPVHVVRLHHRPAAQGVPVGGETGSGHKMTVRAATRGHWRQQWYGSIQSHRHIWIDPFWRGPEGAPVVGGERVFLSHGNKAQQPSSKG